MKHLLFTVIGLSFLVGVNTAQAGWFDQIPTKSGDYCKDEAVDYIKRRYGENVKIFDVKKFGSGTDWAYYASTDLCKGWFMFRYMPQDSWSCKQTQFGRHTRYLMVVAGMDECAKILFSDNNPNVDARD